jgi:hypothetical protein
MWGLWLALVVFLMTGVQVNAACLTLKQAEEKYAGEERLHWHGHHCWGLSERRKETGHASEPQPETATPRPRPFFAIEPLHLYNTELVLNDEVGRRYAQINHMDLLWKLGADWYRVELTYRYKIFWWDTVEQAFYELTGGLVGGARLKLGGDK